MRRIITLIIFLLLFQISPAAPGGEYPARILSLSPSITEILYELGLGDRIIGVTDYCVFPEEAKYKPKVGGYLDTNYEAVILMDPELVIMPVEYGSEVEGIFDGAGIAHMTVDTSTVSGILDSVIRIGSRSGAGDEADGIVRRIREEISDLRKKAQDSPRRRVMIVVGRDAGSFDNLYIAGRDTFYGELLDILGCENVYSMKGMDYPAVSIEGVIRFNPEIIIEMLPGCPEEKKSDIVKEWGLLKEVEAVKRGKIYVFNADYACVPGPRFISILRDISEVL